MRLPLRLVAAAVLVAATSVLVPAAPAAAAECPTSTGVTVVVDFNGLGGGVQARCDASGGGRTAEALFADVKFSLAFTTRERGFVCRVDQKPGPDVEPCYNTPPADAYWALYWSKDGSGWSYASQGVGSLTVPSGGYVGFSWAGGSASPPGLTPSPRPQPSAPASPAPSHPTAHPTAHATAQPTSHASTHPTPSAGSPGTGQGGGGGSPSASPDGAAGTGSRAVGPSTGATARAGGASPSAGERAGRAGHGGKAAQRSPSAGPTPSTAGAEATDPADPVGTSDADVTSAEPTGVDGGGLPVWVAPLAVGILFAAAGVVALVRRRGAGGQ